MIYPARYFLLRADTARGKAVLMNKKGTGNILVLTECSIMIALSSVLSVVKLFEMPYGGSITLAAMLPIVILSYRHGIRVGLAAALVESVIQLFMGLSTFSYFSTWQSLLALALLDYLIAFLLFGLAGAFKGRIKNQSTAMTVGAACASIGRYLCHVISGATIWAGLSIPTEAALLYSLSYNATYMIPESIILVLSCAYIGASLDFGQKIPTRIRSERIDALSSYLYIGAGGIVLAGLITDTVLVFSRLQNADDGEFFIQGLESVNWIAFAIVSAITLALSAAFVIIAKRREAKQSL